ncbi:hypothetical protein [Paraflavitalea speifideaquila]|uniref:hypothetical protein n=1 Tax=Paraflavitalea speifideaquila TaxID=3076558 RepID=UPI0028F0B71A|nr:hypothetical protein [Paraflavitalea speifideiaquila]
MKKRVILHEPGIQNSEDTAEPVVNISPRTIAPSSSRIRRKGIIITIQDKTLSWQIDNLIKVADPEEIKPATKENIKKVIADCQNSLGGTKVSMNFIIRAPKDTRYPVFKTLIDAMKELDLYNFSMEDIPDN